ncbi:MAG: hypothetical protein ACRD08_16570, partial [Acidimicrobiales bacterium]
GQRRREDHRRAALRRRHRHRGRLMREWQIRHIRLQLAELDDPELAEAFEATLCDDPLEARRAHARFRELLIVREVELLGEMDPESAQDYLDGDL